MAQLIVDASAALGEIIGSNLQKKPWPATCSVKDCSSTPTLGAHVANTSVSGERIVPMCDSCNKLSNTFTLKGNVTVPSANKSETCEKP